MVFRLEGEGEDDGIRQVEVAFAYQVEVQV
jgi:hypothetical protein